MTMTKPNLVSLKWLLAASCLLAGCTVTQMKADNQRQEQQVQAKEQELQRAQQRQAELQAERQRLLDDLRTRELTLTEMSRRLEEMQRLNAATVAATGEQQRQKVQREKALADASAQVKALERAPELAPDAKAKRLEDVRKQLRKTLELLAAT